MSNKKFHPYLECGLEEKTRLVIADRSTNTFLQKKIIDELQSIEVSFPIEYGLSNLRYKYQIWSEGRWKDYTKYKRVFHRKKISLSPNANFHPLNQKQKASLLKLSENEILFYFKELLKSFYYYLLPAPTATKILRIKSYIGMIPVELLSSSSVVAHSWTIISIITDYVERYLKKDSFEVSESISMKWYYDALRNISLEGIDKIGFETGSLVAKGHIASLHNRSVAFDSYNAAIAKKTEFLNRFHIIDPIPTYYSEVKSDNDTYEIVEGKNNNASIDLLNTDKHLINICFSTDLRYFQMYATNWANANFYFENLIFNFGIVTNDENEYKHCVDSYIKIMEGIAALLNSKIPDNFRFYWIKSKVINKTVYACARFYLADYLIDKYEQDIFISDIDQLVIGDLEKYLLKINDKNYSIYQPISSGLFSMLPGRSHLAGNIFIRNNIEGQKYCRILVNYVAMGVDEKFSWILDQNATRYASEVVEVGNIDSFGQRALKQYPSLKVKLGGLKSNQTVASS